MRKRSLYVFPTLLALVAAAGAGQGTSRSAKVWIDDPVEFEEFLESAEDRFRGRLGKWAQPT